MSTTTTFRQSFAESEALTITLANLANGSARESDAVDNSTDQYQDALVQIAVQLTSGASLSNEFRVYVYAYGSEDGAVFTHPATGSDAAISALLPTNLVLLGLMEIRDNTGQPVFKSSPMSVAQAFGWILPRKWGIVVVNKTGRAFNSANCAASFSGVFQTAETVQE